MNPFDSKQKLAENTYRLSPVPNESGLAEVNRLINEGRQVYCISRGKSGLSITFYPENHKTLIHKLLQELP